ncbi:type II CAAX prenyl endopeptidase Rce1 family protein [Citricoccus sp.]|uniref:CPBP family glutamic-type intramembrane protease n=1 Tax=Citricoccus sp. TaxID=1978372 RepID=UPI00262A8E0B|nr:CPBP family glutamic-type intramembrane protease [Citricoccus sp.]HRO31136.1 CPBP family glutamic-type intramembrane protease [Citricoccus sp.]
MDLQAVRRMAWPLFLVGALLLLGAGNELLYGITIPALALILVLVVPGDRPRLAMRVDWPDLAVVAVLYTGVVALFWLAFRVFTQQNTLGLFLCFAAGMLLGVVGPVVYTTWIRRRALAELGFRRDNLRQALILGLVLAAVQFLLTLWGYALPRPVDWVPLLFLALTVGLFEVVYFRGFVQTRLEACFGSVPGVGGAAALYAAYHIGYGMGLREMVFLFGLGVVYSTAFAVVRNVAVLWPLLVPMGSFYSNLRGGDIVVPWAAILGFADVLAVMVTVLWFAARSERGRRDGTGTVRRGGPAHRRQPP